LLRGRNREQTAYLKFDERRRGNKYADDIGDIVGPEAVSTECPGDDQAEPGIGIEKEHMRLDGAQQPRGEIK
jgi:hypothetical protein